MIPFYFKVGNYDRYGMIILSAANRSVVYFKDKLRSNVLNLLFPFSIFTLFIYSISNCKFITITYMFNVTRALFK